jgi:hypothetical protein
LACREGILVDLPPGLVTGQFFGVHALNGIHGVTVWLPEAGKCIFHVLA